VSRRLRAAPAVGPDIRRLRDWEPPTWGYRIGDYRFFYEIDEAEKTVCMTLAVHRSVAYRR
jgi:mRNA interferase RelE/StbE